MGKSKRLFLILVSLCIITILTACKKEEGSMSGKWAYNHDKDTTILSFNGNKAEYKGVKYTYTSDDKFITFKDDKSNELKVRYERDKEDMLVYEKNVYTYSGEENPSGIVGIWKNAANNWSFEFTEDGTFMEDGYFPGHYDYDSEAGTVKLMYNDHFQDTICYLTLNGKELSIEYPWRMVPVE